MNLLSFFLLGLALLLILSFAKKGTDIFSPARLFSIVWLFLIGLSLLKLSRYQFEWSWFSWLVIFTTIFSFLLGTFVVYVINFNSRVNSISFIRVIQSEYYSINTYSIFKVILLLFLAYIISYIVIYLVVGFIPAFTPRPNLVRAKWGMFGFGLLIHLTPIILFLAIVFWMRYKNLDRKIIVGLLFLITFGTFFLLYQRFSLVFGMVLAFVYLYYGSKYVTLKNFLVFIVPLIAIIFGLSTIREGQLFIIYLHYLSQMKFPVKYAIFTEPYMYLVMNIENFAYAIEKLKFHTYGLYSFDFLFALSGLKHFLKEYFGITDFPALRSVFYNTYTLFFVYYRDFGLIGSFIFPFLIGMIASHFYYYMRRFPNIHTISFYGMWVCAILFSFFVPLLSWLHFVFDMFVVYFSTKYIHLKSSYKPMEIKI